MSFEASNSSEQSFCELPSIHKGSLISMNTSSPQIDLISERYILAYNI